MKNHYHPLQFGILLCLSGSLPLLLVLADSAAANFPAEIYHFIGFLIYPNNFIFWSLFWSSPPPPLVSDGAASPEDGAGAALASLQAQVRQRVFQFAGIRSSPMRCPTPTLFLDCHSAHAPFTPLRKSPQPTRQRCTVRSTPSFLSLVFTYPHHLFLVSCFIPLSPPRMRCVMLQYRLTSTDIN